MELELYTNRLYIRPFRSEDVDLDIDMATDPEVMRYFGGAVTEDEIVEESTNFIRRCGGGCIGVWTVVDRTTEEKLGEVFLTPLPILEDDTCWELVQGDDIPEGDIELGYLFKRTAWGKGIATEACRRLLRFAFEETPLEQIVAVVDSGNLKSEAVLAKCGFVNGGIRDAYAGNYPSFLISRKHWRTLQTVSS